MTLAELDDLQTRMLKHPGNAKDSSAAGRYQVTRTTMRDVKGWMGLSDDTKFTRQTQDAIALFLLERAGYQRWACSSL